MKSLLHSPYEGLVLTGMAATTALLIESRLQVSSDIHFLLQFVWMGVVGAALLAFALMPALNGGTPATDCDVDSQDGVTAEFLDEDRLWLQTHPDSSWNEQV